MTRCRSLTVAKVDSIGLVVRRWIPAYRLTLASASQELKAATVVRVLANAGQLPAHTAGPDLSRHGMGTDGDAAAERGRQRALVRPIAS